MKTSFLSLACALALLLAGCISNGRPFDAAQTAQIRSGHTTEADLEKLFGPPFSRSPQDDGTTKLVWQHTTVGVGVGITEQQELFVTTKAGVVVDYSVRQKGH